jgi:hypothetical protein
MFRCQQQIEFKMLMFLRCEPCLWFSKKQSNARSCSISNKEFNADVIGVLQPNPFTDQIC